MTVEVSKSRDQSLSIVLLKLMESATVEDSAENCIHIEWLFMIDWNDSIQVFRGVKRNLWLSQILRILLICILETQVLYDRPCQLNCVQLVVC